MSVVTKREFTRNIYRHLTPGEYVVTKNGEPHLVVTIKAVNGTLPIESVVTQTPKSVVTPVVTRVKHNEWEPA
jgi:hypothetical protein